MADPVASLPLRRFTLRDLPMPAKLVISLFLISVGVGYFSALVQLHMQHSSRDGEPMPTLADVIEKFSGVVRSDAVGVIPVSKVAGLLAGDPHGGFNKNNMVPAFYEKSGKKEYAEDVATRGAAIVDAERAGEHKALLAWIATDPAARKAAWDADKFAVAADFGPITADYLKDGTVQIQSVFNDRCNKCHAGQQQPDMSDFAKLEPLITAPAVERIPGLNGVEWVRTGRQTSVESLTQSTHAHLLSFSMLFSLTGLVIALSRYPVVVRAGLGCVVLIAQLADIACWWLARLDTYGPAFATCIIGTGTVVGLGLLAQIVLGLLDLYDRRGKVGLAVVALLAAVVFGTLVVKVIEPALRAEREKAAIGKSAGNVKNAGTVPLDAERKLIDRPEVKGAEPAVGKAKPADDGPVSIPPAGRD